MRHLTGIVMAGLLSGSLHAAPTLQSILIPDISVPSDCRRSANQYPLNDRVTKIWTYRTYAMVMPPYKRKEARSFDCGGVKGTLYYFEYASPEQREKATLFARPVLSKSEGTPAVYEWEKGFVIFSFSEMPTTLQAETFARIKGTASVTEVPKPVVPVVQALVEQPPVKPVELPKPPAPAKTAPEIPKAPASSLSGMVSPGPSAASDPFSPKGSSSLTSRPVTAPPPPPVAPRINPAPPPPVPKPIAAVVVPPAPPKSMVPLAKPVAAPVAGAADLNSAVLESYAFKIGCQNEQRPSDVIAVCVLMQDFASGLPVELPLEDGVSRIGPIYTIDSYGRFAGLHQNALVGTSNPSVVSFFPLESKGGQDDFEIKSLIEARQKKTALPDNATRMRIQDTAQKKRFGWSKTNSRSMTLQPSGDRRLFVRRAGDRLIFVGTSGTSIDEQTRSSLVVSVLY